MVTPTVTVLETFQTNPSFYTDTARSGSGELITLYAPVAWDDEQTRVSLKPTVNAGEARGATGVGQHNRSLDFSATTQRATVQWRALGTYLHSDLFGPTATDLGRVSATGFTITDSANLGATWHATQRDVVDVDAVQSRAAYHPSTAGTSPYLDYRYTSGTLQYARDYSEVTQLLLTLSGGEYLPARGGVVSNDRGIQVGFSRHFTESITLVAMGGRSTVSRAGDAQRTTGDIYSVTGTWERPTTRASLSAKRSRQPGPFGDLTLETDLRLTSTTDVTARWQLTANATYTKIDDTFVGFTLARRDIFTFEGVASYMLTPQWRLELHLTDAHVSLPSAIYNAHAVAATNRGGLLSVSRAFAPTKIF